MSLSIYSDEHFMKQALNEAQNAYDEGEIPIGAVVVCENKIIAKDHNRVERLNDATAHAEMLAITAAQNNLSSKYLNECTLFVTLEPCSMCAGGLFWTQIGRVVIGALDKERGFSKYSKDIVHPKTDLKMGVMANECEVLIKDFFKNIRKK
ncbi:tRNA(adenine34) deaminase [Ekhidna lutea]|uniref:tRNA-specific adenosine deaminase n=1 Tax=Ekhidna lutea TaxID=447679 RepID=A0A239J457_EKHLU|nr:nucleoside deaminase [Ekhidna lutea]SNT00589.1 tRNA(adenine34) deaminase [Ekhidna lutea]